MQEQNKIYLENKKIRDDRAIKKRIEEFGAGLSEKDPNVEIGKTMVIKGAVQMGTMGAGSVIGEAVGFVKGLTGL